MCVWNIFFHRINVLSPEKKIQMCQSLTFHNRNCYDSGQIKKVLNACFVPQKNSKHYIIRHYHSVIFLSIQSSYNILMSEMILVIHSCIVKKRLIIFVSFSIQKNDNSFQKKPNVVYGQESFRKFFSHQTIVTKHCF